MGQPTLTTGDITTRVGRTEVVTIYLRGMNRDPTLWPDPTEFRSERHTDPSAEQQRALLPFGLGPRSCIGQHLALAELAQATPRWLASATSNLQTNRERIRRSPSGSLTASAGDSSAQTLEHAPVSRDRFAQGLHPLRLDRQ